MAEALFDPSSTESPTSDWAAITEVRHGNREMFEVLVRRYNQRLFRVGMSYLHDHAQAEDAMQNAYLKAFLHLDRFQREAGFGTWLTRIMINECLMALRQRRRAAEDPLFQTPETVATIAPQGADRLNLREMKTLLEKTIGALPQKLRAVYVLREVQQLNTAETAACLGLSSASVKVTLHRAREKLKTELLKSAAGLELFPFGARYCDPLTAKIMAVVLSVD